MFDVFYRSLSMRDRNVFIQNVGLSRDTIKNSYLSVDPLKRRIPKPETMVSMIKNSKGQLNIITLLDYFHVATMVELMKLDNVSPKDIKRNLSILHPANFE
jgi:hypothetical protein